MPEFAGGGVGEFLEPGNFDRRDNGFRNRYFSGVDVLEPGPAHGLHTLTNIKLIEHLVRMRSLEPALHRNGGITVHQLRLGSTFGRCI